MKAANEVISSTEISMENHEWLTGHCNVQLVFNMSGGPITQ
jgi:hypothetical protein